MNAIPISLALLQIGGGEIILILVLLLVLVVVAATVVGVVYLIVRAVQNRPLLVPSTLTPEAFAESLRKRDVEHLKLLSIFHFVFAGLALLGIAFLVVHYAMFHIMFSKPEMWKSQPAGPPPKEFLEAFIWFYFFMGGIFLLAAVLNALSGLFLRRQQHRVFSLVISGLNCLQIPFGTALGVFTIVVLSRESVRGLYSGDAT